MAKDKIYEDLSLVVGRAKGVFFVLAVCFALMMGYYWKVQILDYSKYWKLSEANRLRERVLPAPRGLIRDRGEVILAENTAGFKASIILENTRDLRTSCRKIGRLLGIEETDLKARIDKYKGSPSFVPIIIKDNLTMDEVALIEGRKIEFPELFVEVEPKRFYPCGKFASHVLGYLQELTPEEIKSEASRNRRMGDMGGRTGIERQYDGLLTGNDGRLLEVVDSLGKSRGEVALEEPRPGQNLSLTLDFDIQKKAEELLEGREGSIVVMDPRDGGILALASFPTYDPNRFINRFSPEEWTSLAGDPAFPLENRAIRGLYSPGSIFKVVLAIGGLESGLIDENTAYFCNGSVEIYGYPFSCWFKSGHGLMNLANGIKNSCNVYFYNLGRKMGIENIARFAGLLGLGKQTGIDIPGEKEGLVPDPEWKQRTYKKPWFAGETISVSIGQGPLLVTPIQIARLTACVASRGILVRPHFWEEAKGGGDGGNKTAVAIRQENFEKVIEGMWKSVNNEGTGRGAAVEGFDVCGKTGSTQWISLKLAEKLSRQGKEVKKTHSWFSGFAPRNSPRVVVTVLVEFGGGGGATAAPLARELFDLYKKKYD